MAKAKRNHQIAEDFAAFDEHMKTAKFIVPEYVVSEHKGNHSGSFGASESVVCTNDYGNTTLDCEIRRSDIFNYSFSYLSDKIDNRVLARLDVGDGVHNNRAPGIPLALTSVPTPHIHKYRSDGYFVAYPIEGVDYSSESSLLFDCYRGYDYLCNELNIGISGGEKPKFTFQPRGQMTLYYGIEDPNAGVSFGNIDE